MRQLFVVVTKKGADDNFLNRLYSEIGGETAAELTHDRLCVAWDEQDALIKKLAKAIVRTYEKRFVLKIINKKYAMYGRSEKLAVWKTAMYLLARDESEENTEYLHRYRIVQFCLHEYLETSNRLVVEGFVNFRLQDYYAELEEVVDLAVEEYLLEREYDEFIKMLRYFVALQPAKYSRVDLIWQDGFVQILGDGADITELCSGAFRSENPGAGAMPEEDLVVSALISAAPSQIILHHHRQMQSRAFLQTLHRVFVNKVTVCDGCALCDGKH